MAHPSHPAAAEEQVHLGLLAPKLLMAGVLMAVLGLGTGVSLYLTGRVDTRAFFHSYLLAVCYFIVISLGALFFVMLQHITRAGWSVSVRRLAELLSTSLPFLVPFLLPVLYLVWQHNGALHVWADPHHLMGEEVLRKKAGYFDATFFTCRFALYAVVWTVVSRFFFKNSVSQDEFGDVGLTYKMQWVAAPSIAAFALTATFFIFDFIMSLEPGFYSTVFGVYVFIGGFMSVQAVLILMAKYLQGHGILAQSVHREHYHDLGKLLFGFVFFWGYIAFSQYMLIWYGNIPEETVFFMHRQSGLWASVSLALLFGHFVLPFPGLLSRHVKRNGKALVFWALWLLAMEYLDLYWLIMPSGALVEGHGGHMEVASGPRFGLLEISLFVGMAGVYLTQLTLRARSVPLRPLKDPRLEEALAFENI